MNVIIEPFSKIWYIWTRIWEKLPTLVNFWNYKVINDTLDKLEQTEAWQWIAENFHIPNITIPVDFTLGEFILTIGIETVMGIAILITILKLLDLILFFT